MTVLLAITTRLLMSDTIVVRVLRLSTLTIHEISYLAAVQTTLDLSIVPLVGLHEVLLLQL
jgi:hypothetical protein